MNFLRVSTLLLPLLIFVCAVAQAKEYICFDMPVWVVQTSPLAKSPRVPDG
jgi:hypothetical protein